MAVFRDANQVYELIGGLHEWGAEQEEMGRPIRDAGIVARFDYDEPQATITVDAKSEPPPGKFFVVYYGEPPTSLPKPDVRLKMKADVAHRFWQGKVNLVTALATRQIVANGSLPKMLKLLPVVTPAFKAYPTLLREHGHEEMVIS
jgi:hypothetical protein